MTPHEIPDEIRAEFSHLHKVVVEVQPFVALAKNSGFRVDVVLGSDGSVILALPCVSYYFDEADSAARFAQTVVAAAHTGMDDADPDVMEFFLTSLVEECGAQITRTQPVVPDGTRRRSAPARRRAVLRRVRRKRGGR